MSCGSASRLLIVDDDEVLRNRMSRAFRERGFDVADAANVVDAEKISASSSFDRALIDLRMPGESGLTLIAQLKVRHPGIQIVMLSGYGSIATAVDAVKLGATHFLTKPADIDEILVAFTSGGAVSTKASLPNSVPPLERVEWEHIQRVMSECNGNISKAAKLLRVHRRSLQRKLSKAPALKESRGRS